MTIADKLRILADGAKYDASCASSGAVRKGTPNGIGNSDGNGICHSYTPDGRCVSLLKILLTNYCIYDCQYCVNAEDIAGRPFVGPAGEVLNGALAAAGLDRRRLYLTNAVKHFSFEPRGKRRIHQTPRLSDVHACRPWLEAELKAIRPATIVAMGSTAARTLLGPQARVMTLRGRVLEGLAWAPRVIVTVHPAAVLRSEEDGQRYLEVLVRDLTLAGADHADHNSGTG